jgi:hypothetical protein
LSARVIERKPVAAGFIGCAQNGFNWLVPLRERKRMIHRVGHHAGNPYEPMPMQILHVRGCRACHAENDGHSADKPVVSMTHRALPLIGLLAAATKAESNVSGNESHTEEW